jgi:hypothetical protein
MLDKAESDRYYCYRQQENAESSMFLTEGNKMDVNTVGYYLPKDVQAWIKSRAEAENRSASNYLATLIRKMMQDASNL